MQYVFKDRQVPWVEHVKQQEEKHMSADVFAGIACVVKAKMVNSDNARVRKYFGGMYLNNDIMGVAIRMIRSLLYQGH